jgi:hypothetical protein
VLGEYATGRQRACESRRTLATIGKSSALTKTYEAMTDWVDCISYRAGGSFMAD